MGRFKRMPPKLAAAIVAAGLTLTGLLSATPAAHAGWRTDRATAIARIVYHHPCVDRMQIRGGIAPAGSEDASAWTWVDDCVVWLDRTEPLAWEPFCTTVLHEAGHLAGMGHSDRPGSVMSAFLTFGHRAGSEHWTGTDPRCRDRGRPYLERFGAL